MNENDVTYKMIKLMNSVSGCHARKRHGGAFTQGDPDIAGVVLGRAFFCEVKVVGGELTKLQAVMLDKWKLAGADTSVAVYNYGARQLRIIQADGDWADLAGLVDKIEGGRIIALDHNGIFNWVRGIPDHLARQGDS